MAIYIAIGFLFCLYDAFVGFTCGFYESIESGPTVSFAAFFWPIALPIIMFIEFGNLCKKIKKKRLEKEKQQEKVRIATQKEIDKTLEELEQEFEQPLKRKRK